MDFEQKNYFTVIDGVLEAFCVIPFGSDEITRFVDTSNPKLKGLVVEDRLQIDEKGHFSVPDGVAEIGVGAFDGTNLASISLPCSVKVIRDRAFKQTRLTSIAIPGSVAKIGAAIFLGCDGLMAIHVDPTNTVYDDCGCNVIVEKATHTLLCGCNGSAIPDDVDVIADSAFDGCERLADARIPRTVSKIGSYAFSMCSALTTLFIPDSVKEIGDSAFCCCDSLQTISVPQHLSSSPALAAIPNVAVRQ